MRRFSREEWEILRRSTVTVGPGQPAPLDRETALILFHQLAELAERYRRTRPLGPGSTGCSIRTQSREDSVGCSAGARPNGWTPSAHSPPPPWRGETLWRALGPRRTRRPGAGVAVPACRAGRAGGGPRRLRAPGPAARRPLRGRAPHPLCHGAPVPVVAAGLGRVSATPRRSARPRGESQAARAPSSRRPCGPAQKRFAPHRRLNVDSGLIAVRAGRTPKLTSTYRRSV